MTKTKKRIVKKISADSGSLDFHDQPVLALPDFRLLLEHPLVSAPLPTGFSIAKEAEHLTELWNNSYQLQEYHFDKFVHAGGSGMVFKVRKGGSETYEAM